MPTHAPVKSGSFTLAPEGTHMARCFQFVHIGTIQDSYMGQPTEFNKIRLTFELPEELHVFKEEKGPQPMVISQDYTLSLGEKANLRKLVEGIVGHAMTNEEAAAFDVESLVGMPCLLLIKHKTSVSGKKRAEISGASPLVKSMIAPAPVNPPRYLTYNNFDTSLFDTLPDFLKDKIRGSVEFKAMLNGDGSNLSEEDKANIQALRQREIDGKKSAAEVTSRDIPF